MSRTQSAIFKIKELSSLQVIRFLIVGVVSFLIEFCVFTALINGGDVLYTHANLPAMAIAILCNYYLTKWFVFEAGRYGKKTTFVLFMAFTLMGVGLNQFLLWFTVEQLSVNVYISKVVAVALVAIFNFFTKKHFVF